MRSGHRDRSRLHNRTFRHVVAIQYLATGSPDRLPSGEPNQEWTDLLSSVSASVEPTSGREIFASQQNIGQVDARVRIRYRSDIDSAMRVLFGDRVYEIVAVIDPEMRHDELHLMCKERTDLRGTVDGSLEIEDGGLLILE